MCQRPGAGGGRSGRLRGSSWADREDLALTPTSCLPHSGETPTSHTLPTSPEAAPGQSCAELGWKSRWPQAGQASRVLRARLSVGRLPWSHPSAPSVWSPRQTRHLLRSQTSEVLGRGRGHWEAVSEDELWGRVIDAAVGRGPLAVNVEVAAVLLPVRLLPETQSHAPVTFARLLVTVCLVELACGGEVRGCGWRTGTRAAGAGL